MRIEANEKSRLIPEIVSTGSQWPIVYDHNVRFIDIDGYTLDALEHCANFTIYIV